MFLRAGARDAIITGHLVSLSEEESADCDTTDSDGNGGWTEGACECLSAVLCMTNSFFIPYRQGLKEAIVATACPTNRVAKVTEYLLLEKAYHDELSVTVITMTVFEPDFVMVKCDSRRGECCQSPRCGTRHVKKKAASKAAAKRAAMCLRAPRGFDSTETSMFITKTGLSLLSTTEGVRVLGAFTWKLTGQTNLDRTGSDSMGSLPVSVPISLQAILCAPATDHDHPYDLLWLKVAICQMSARHINRHAW